MEDYYANHIVTTDTSWKFNPKNIKQIKTANGLAGVFYDSNDKITPKKLVMFPYPNNLEPKSEMAIHMRSFEGLNIPISAEQSDAFIKIVDSFQFTK